MISDKEKVRKTKTRENSTEHPLGSSYYEDEVDFKLLFESLDNIFKDDTEEEIDNNRLPQHPIMENQNLVSLVTDMYQKTSWDTIDQLAEDRPKACLICQSINCEHINHIDTRMNVDQILEKAVENCTHIISEDWLFDDVCSRCILSSCESVTPSSTPQLRILWDESDFMQYHNWINKIDKDNMLKN
ncbi:MAG: hypothetical protein ACC656_12060 [Candidatus Heimdallarchaeota archaeon]